MEASSYHMIESVKKKESASSYLEVNIWKSVSIKVLSLSFKFYFWTMVFQIQKRSSSLWVSIVTSPIGFATQVRVKP